MILHKSLLAIVLVLAAAHAAGGSAPISPCDLCGTWLLVERLDRTPAGEVVPEPNLGVDPLGLLVYDRSGTMAVQLMRRVRKPASGAAIPRASTGANNSGTDDGYDAYFGSYELDTKAGIVTHILQGALEPADVGKRLTRNYVLRGDELTLSFITKNGGTAVSRTLRWRRKA